MLAELSSWWTEQMSELVAPLLRHTSGKAQDALVLECDGGGGGWRVVRRRGGARTELATIPDHADDDVWRRTFATRRRGEPVVVALGQPFLVRRTTVPAAASANLERLLGYEMDRLTPFAADDVLFSHCVRSRDQAAGTLLVEVAIVPKIWALEPLERLAALSIRPSALEERSEAASVVDGPEGEPLADAAYRRISLDHVDPAAAERAQFGRTVLISACVGLAIAVVAAPFVRQSIALVWAEDQITALRPRMDQVDELRRRIAAGSAGAGQIAAARERASVALRALGVLTDLLPDDTFLTSLSLRRDRLTIEGRSAAATKLIAALTTDPHLKNPSFAAPVVRGENGADVFTIQSGFGS
jgi:general secretion pathway protein L